MKPTTRIGKIARLPKAIRETLNQRLEDGATARSLVAWLNRLPEVKAIVQEQFGGIPIREQNLSQWKNGGYRDWLQQQEARELAVHLYDQAEALQGIEGQPPLSEVLALWLASQYAAATREIAEADGVEGWRLLRQMCADVVKLRKVDQNAERLDLERERIDLARDRFAAAHPPAAEEKPAEAAHPWSEWSDAERMAWAKERENLDRLLDHPDGQTDENSHMDRIFQDRTDDDPYHERLRQLVERWTSEGRREWTMEERIAWARLPENYDRIVAKNGDPVAAARRIRAHFGQQTAADKAYYAQARAEAETEEGSEKEDGATAARSPSVSF